MAQSRPEGILDAAERRILSAGGDRPGREEL